LSRLPSHPHTLEHVRDWTRKHGQLIDDESPAGTINGINAVFTLANIPRDGSLKLYSDGMRVPAANITATITAGVYTITLAAGSIPTATLSADYRAG
jgi:hypothetical protein